ncbi:MAG: 4Fe-4S binding protein [Candidatus Omnitrophica bacterium]|nr:4Fe-4S binding protein [Candidatus Omnitrophota bacterium]
MNIEQLKWKLVETPLIPIKGSWVDAAPFISLLVLFALSILIILRLKKRQALRHVVQSISLFIFAFTFHRCFCTVRGWVFGIAEIGKDNLSVFQNMCIFIPIFASLFVFGRIFCGWVCPLGFIQECLRKLNIIKRKIILLLIYTIIMILILYHTKPVNFFFVQNIASILGLSLMAICFFFILNPKTDTYLKKIKYISLIFWTTLIVLGVFTTSPWCSIYGNEIDYSSLLGFIAVLFAGSVVSMAWCRYICPLGGLFALLSRFYQYYVKGTHVSSPHYKTTCPMGAIANNGSVDKENCIYCLRCTEKHGFKVEESKIGNKNS